MNSSMVPPQTRSIGQLPLYYKGVIKTAICIPSSCTEDDASLGMSYYLWETMNPNEQGEVFVSYPLGCQSEDTEIELSDDDWVMAIVLIIFGLVISLATSLDMFIKFVHPLPINSNILGVIHGFSLYNNLQKLFDSKPSSDNLGCINGIRFISMTWVVVGHVFQNFTMLNGIGFLSNVLYIFSPDGPATTPASAAIWNADSSVDSFFLIGAILLSFLTLKQLDKNKTGSMVASFKMWIMFYIHRYLRISGLFAMIIGLHATLLQHLLNYGPQGHLMDYTSQACRDDWWVNLLYISNFNVKGEEDYYGPKCLPHTWYLNVDMQLFIFTPFVIYPLWKYPIIGSVIGIVITIIGTVIPLAIVWAENPWEGGWSGVFEDFYIKPWNRIQPYIIGILVGFFLFKTKDNKTLPINFIINLICWIVAALVAIACIYGIQEYSPTSEKIASHYQYILYVGFSRLAWALAISWVIVACVRQKGGPVNEFLSWSGFVPGARISYAMYLAHWTVVSWYNSVQRNNVTYSTELYIYYCLANVFMTAGVSLALVLCFEMPILHLEKLLFGIFGLSAMPKPRKDDIEIAKKDLDIEKKKISYEEGADREKADIKAS